MQAVDHFAAIVGRRQSCRSFAAGALDPETIRTILELAQQTASWNNVQPWQVVITTDAATERFRKLMTSLAESGATAETDIPFPREYRGTALARRRACGFQLYGAVGIERGDKAAYARQGLRNYAFFDAPHVAIVTVDEALGTYGAVDCGAYVTTFMLAAQALGVGTIAQAALAVHSVAIRRHFGLGEERRVVCGIAFGRPNPDDPVNGYRTPRASLDEVVQWETE